MQGVVRRIHSGVYRFVCLPLAVAALLLNTTALAEQAHPTDPSGLKEEIKREILEELKSEDTTLAKLRDRFELGLLLEFGGVWKDEELHGGGSEDESSFAMTTVELSMGAHLVDWVAGEAVFLYEDPTFDEETSVDIDVATITIGNTDTFPLFITGGALYVPFGALYTHFPDDPLIDVPLTLLLGETREKAVLAGCVYEGLSLSAYAFNGDVDERGNDDHIESYGVDAHYDWQDTGELGLAVTVGASYISNIADSDGVTDTLEVDDLEDYVGGFGAYLHTDCGGFFLLAEYMTATDEFDPAELAEEGGDGAQPAVWNIEAGYNWNWGRNLEIALKYAGSDEAGGLGFPESRYGINFNQELCDGLIFSLGYLHDEFEDNDAEDRDERELVFGQLAFEF
jgi:hypothetical protein